MRIRKALPLYIGIPDAHLLASVEAAVQRGLFQPSWSMVMTESWRDPFSKAEIIAARRAARDEAGILTEVLALMRRVGRQLPFAEDVLAAWHCVRDPETSARVKLILLAALAYVVLPIDGVPDFIPLLGFTDDAAMLATAIAAVRGAITNAHREMARETLAESGEQG